VHNSFQILAKNIELAKKELALAEAVDKELADHLVGDALENLVSAFDGFGREVCRQKAADIHFQNLTGARRRVQEAFGFDFADALAAEDWERACRVFQKRHLLAHKMGVIDADYAQRANDPGAVAGRKIDIARDEVTWTIGLLEALGRSLFDGILPQGQRLP
jgi:HJR/Mrr/RecB family endonuclease